MKPVRTSILESVRPSPVFWIASGGYLLSVAVLEVLLRTAWIRSLVAGQRDRLLKSLFDYYGDFPARNYYGGQDYSRGFDATGSVIQHLGGSLFYLLLVVG